ncbi:SDR family oxidoreductase [Novosphingobium sp.]|uniref:SDR family NAD(P)-dependent oxidoreductase n=1 Tax=Novosphingobium sp. TaxID=1874826 RepID=UPI002604FB7A|nr:SDR family oxidoreductase [Novosphingobium sp.]
MRLKGKVALITGAGSGLGRATAQLFAREGALVVGCGRTLAKGHETVRLIEEAGHTAAFVQGDIAEMEDVQRIIAETVRLHGRLDILVNNASVGPSSGYVMNDIADMPEADWDAVLHINLRGTFLFCKYGVQQMRKNGGGVIANVASIGGTIGMFQNHNYCVSKAGVISLTKCLAMTYAREGIRANCIAAGAFESDMIAPMQTMLDEVMKDDNARFLFAPAGRLSTPEEMAPSLLYLCSDDSSYMHGACIVVDGGTTIGPIPSGMD